MIPGDSWLELSLSIIFILSVILIWFMIFYQLILTMAGFFHFTSAKKEKKKIDSMAFDFPGVTILIPAHNEAKVISYTLEAMTKLDYPKEKLDILVINDGSSDRTAEIVEEYARKDSRVRLYNVPKGEGGRGKSRVLNLGLKQTVSKYIAVYDADNTPEPSALKYLMSQMLLDDSLGAALGKFRTVNKNKNLLTRFINIETLGFQSMLQSGRWMMFKIATLPGTNLVIRRDLLDKLNGWDEDAITEDSELSIRIYKEGYRIKFIPYSVTWEQEPESWRVWVKQRTRWVQGNNYVGKKFLKEIPSFKNKFLAVELLYVLSLYYVFLIALLSSDILFILGALKIISINLPGPYTLVWIIGVVLFEMEILLALSYDREDKFSNLLMTLIMYFTYCQLWIFVIARAIYLDIIKKEKSVWVKTERFNVNAGREKR